MSSLVFHYYYYYYYSLDFIHFVTVCICAHGLIDKACRYRSWSSAAAVMAPKYLRTRDNNKCEGSQWTLTDYEFATTSFWTKQRPRQCHKTCRQMKPPADAPKNWNDRCVDDNEGNIAVRRAVTFPCRVDKILYILVRIQVLYRMGLTHVDIKFRIRSDAIRKLTTWVI